MLGCKLCFYFVLVFLLFQIVESVQVVGQYYVSENRSTWLQASGQCSLATPDIDFLTLSADISSSLLKEDLWVGYYTKYTAFEYTGCMSTNGYPAKLLKTDMNLRRCQSACGDVMNIGISRTACFCVNTKPLRDIHQSGCLDTCGIRTVCGGKGYMSLYRAVKESEITITTDDKELCLKYKDKNIVWKNCSKSFKTICSYDNGTVRLLDGNTRPWNKSVQACLRLNGLPTSLNSFRSVINVTEPVWTGIIKGSAVYKVDESTILSPALKMFGFVTKKNANAVLQFSKSSQKLLRGLCKFETPVPTGNETPGNDITKRKETPVPTGNETPGNDITYQKGLIVGITVPLVITVTAAVVVLVVLIRRRNVSLIYKRRRRTGLQYDNSNNSVSDKRTPSAHINQAFEQLYETIQKEHVDCGQETQKDDTSYAHDYFVLENERSYPKDSTYDSTVNGQSAAKRENVNVYDTTESGSTYDLTFHRGLNKEQGISNKYDSLENTITGSSSYKTTYQPVDDTYNHTKGMQEVKNVKTDNIYDIQMRNVDLTDAGNQDAYNHLNSKPVVKPDQIYDVPEQ